jgi:hypothetical protein
MDGKAKVTGRIPSVSMQLVFEAAMWVKHPEWKEEHTEVTFCLVTFPMRERRTE